MLGFQPLSAAPISAFVEFAYAAGVLESAAVSENTFVVQSIFQANSAETVTVSDAASATAGFGSGISESAAGADTTSVLAGFGVLAYEEAVATDEATVIASTFSASVSETATALDRLLAFATFISVLSDGAVTADAVASRFLWIIIDDGQTPNWQNISTN